MKETRLQKWISVLSLITVVSLLIAATTGVKISDYPNKPNPADTDLFILAQPNVANFNIQWAQVKSALNAAGMKGDFYELFAHQPCWFLSAAFTNLSVYADNDFGGVLLIGTDEDTINFQATTTTFNGGRAMFGSEVWVNESGFFVQKALDNYYQFVTTEDPPGSGHLRLDLIWYHY